MSYGVAFVLFLILPLTISKSPASESTIRSLREVLLKDYVVNARPTFNHQNATVVEIGFMPVHITELNENRGILTLETRFLMGWRDDHLKWDPANFSGLGKIRLGVQDVWKPDISVYEGRGNLVNPWHSIFVELNHTGYVTWIPSSSMEVYCGGFNYYHYPNDNQTCTINLGSWTYDLAHVDLKFFKEKVRLDRYSSMNPHWELVEVTQSRKVEDEADDPEPFVSIEYKLSIQRMNVPHSALHQISDNVARVLVLCMFWIVGATRKFLTGFTALIICSILAVGITISLPSPAAASAALFEVNCTLGLCMAAIIVEIIVTTLVGCTLESPSWIDNLVGSCFCRTITLCQVPGQSKKEDRQEVMLDTERRASLWPVLATVLDRIAFVVFVVLFIAL